MIGLTAAPRRGTSAGPLVSRPDGIRPTASGRLVANGARALIACLGVSLLAAAGPAAAQSQDAAGPGPEPLYEFKAEIRGRAQARTGVREEAAEDDTVGVSRLRLSLAARPAKHLKLFVEGQDSRVRWLAPGNDVLDFRNALDLRRAYVELGNAAGRATLSVGRRELSFLGERLLAVRNFSNLAPTWDGSMLTLRKGVDSVNLLGYSLVENIAGFDVPSPLQFVYGAIGSINSWAEGHTLEPFVLNTRRPQILESNHGGLLRTFGSRLAGEFAGRWGYEVMLAGQVGGEANRVQRAWMGHWAVSRKIDQVPTRPMLVLEWSHATGDSDPNDGRIGTFDEFNSARHAYYGEHDIVGLRNLKALKTGVQLHPHKALRVNCDYFDFRLATVRDGLYGTDGEIWIAAPVGGATSDAIGSEVDLVLRYNPVRRIELALRVSRFFAGEFVNRHRPEGAGKMFLATELLLRL